MSSGFVILFLLVLLSVLVAYGLAYKPQKNVNFMAAANRFALHAKQAFLLLLAGASTIPSILIIQDRWLGYPIGVRAIDTYWWYGLISFPLAYPRYFVLVFVVMVSIWVIVFFWQQTSKAEFLTTQINEPISTTNNKAEETVSKNGDIFIWLSLGIAVLSLAISLATKRIPGWELILALGIYTSGWLVKEYDRDKVRQYFLDHGGLLFDTAIFVASFCGVLYAFFGETPALFFYIIFFLAAVNLYRNKRKLPAIFWISIFSLAALAWKINGWEYVVIGDDYSFYDGIRNVLENRTTWQLINTTFDGNFIFGTHPYFSSYIQVFFMKIFGDQNFGWRFGNPLLVAASLFLFYYFFEYFTGKQIASITIILLGFSHYLLSFAKIGYNNLQAFFALGLILALFTWSLKSMRLICFAFLGLAMGGCLYIYPAAFYILPLPIIGLLMYLPPVNQFSIKRWGWMILSCMLLLYPLFVQPKYWEEKVPGTFLFTQAGSSTAGIIENMGTNILYSLFSYLYIPMESHYVSSGYLDPLSAVFVVFGSATLISMMITRNKQALFLLLGFAILLILAGATHGRSYPTTTRMFLLLPWFTLFAAYGIQWIFNKFSILFNINRPLSPVILLGTIILLNLYNAYSVDIYRSTQYHSMPPLFIRTVRLINERNGIPAKTYYFAAEKGWNVNGMLMHQWVYHIPESPRQIISLFLEDEQLPENAEMIASDMNNVIIVRADMDAKIAKDIDFQLLEWGKTMCEIKNERDVVQFQLWHSGDLAWLCN